MSRATDITGLIFGRLKALRATDDRRSGSVVWECQCECGAVTSVAADKLRSGKTRSCGCLRSKHGLTGTPEHAAWVSMRSRCYKKYSNRYHSHGARGITVCDRWLESFENFLEDMGPRPHPSLSLERIDNDGPYSPLNCRWATDSEQASNRRSSIVIEFRGRSQCLKAWCRELNLNYMRTRKRIVTYKWSIEKAFSTIEKLPHRESK